MSLAVIPGDHAASPAPAPAKTKKRSAAVKSPGGASAVAVRGDPATAESPGQGRGAGASAAGGPTGGTPLVRFLRARQPDARRTAHAWLDRFGKDRHAAVAELVSMVLCVADVPAACPKVEREDVQEREPEDVVQELVAALALEASEKGADFSQHWLVSRERGAVRVRENYPAFWRELATAADGTTLLGGGLLQLLRGWALALAECQFRSVRHAAALAGLQLVEGLGAQCRTLRDFCSTAEVQVKDAEVQRATGRLASLTAELEHAKACARDLAAARDNLGITLLSRRTKDADPEVRRSCFEALRRWAAADGEAFADPLWTKYLHFGLNDRDAGARAAVLVALQELFRGDGAVPSPAVKSLAEHVRPRVLARCNDIDPAVGAPAVRCAAALAARGLLAEEEFDPVVDLIWDPDAQRRGEAAAFVSRFVFTEDILDYPAGNGPLAAGGPLLPTGGGGKAARRRLLMLLQFLGEYAEGHYQLVDRLVAALWRRASCLEDWETICGMALPGGEHTLAGDQHTALVHLAEAVTRLASEDALAATASGRPEGAAHAEAVLDRAARALAPRLPQLLATSQAEPAALRRAAGLCRHLLRHCVQRGSGGSAGCDGLLAGPRGEQAAEALKAAFLRQPDPEALEHLAEALAHLLDLSENSRPVVRGLATALHGRFMELAPALQQEEAARGGQEAEDVPVAEMLLSTATRLRILTKAFDVSLCDLSGFGAQVLGLLDDRAAAAAEDRVSPVSAHLALVLLELMMLLLIRHAAALHQPEPLAHCVVHDPINREELELAPTAAADLSAVAAGLMRKDPHPHVRSAALAAALAMLTAWWNGRCFGTALAAPAGAAQKMLPLSADLGDALCGHFGELLIEANGVPADSSHFKGAPEAGNLQRSSANSDLFAALQLGIAGAGAETAGAFVTADSDRVKIAVLGCALVANCRHPDVVASHLPALVLSQSLSPREDLQEAAWRLLRRLRKDAYHHSEVAAGGLFSAFLQAVRVVHQDAGAEVAKDLSFKLLPHVGVGKLPPALQAALLAALRAGITAALSGEVEREGFLEALIPWVTKHIVDDTPLRELAAWADDQAAAATGREGGGTAEEVAQAVGLPAFVEACLTVAERGERQPAADAPVPTPEGRVDDDQAMAEDADAEDPVPSPRRTADPAPAQKRRRRGRGAA